MNILKGEVNMKGGYMANCNHFTGKKRGKKISQRKKNPRSKRVHKNKYSMED